MVRWRGSLQSVRRSDRERLKSCHTLPAVLATSGGEVCQHKTAQNQRATQRQKVAITLQNLPVNALNVARTRMTKLK